MLTFASFWKASCFEGQFPRRLLFLIVGIRWLTLIKTVCVVITFYTLGIIKQGWNCNSPENQGYVFKIYRGWILKSVRLAPNKSHVRLCSHRHTPIIAALTAQRGAGGSLEHINIAQPVLIREIKASVYVETCASVSEAEGCDKAAKAVCRRPEEFQVKQSKEERKNPGRGLQSLCRNRHHHTPLVGLKWWLRGIVFVSAYTLFF